MADVVLVYPKNCFIEKVNKHKFLPISLLSCAVYLDKEYDVKIIDQRLNSRWKEDLLAELKENPLCVGVSSVTGEQIKYALEISRVVKGNSNVQMVWGGIHPSLLPEQTLHNENVDIVVEAEGEITFKELVECLDKKEDIQKVKGLWYKEKGKNVYTGKRDIVDLEKLPELPYHLVNIEDYLLEFDGRKTLLIETSRGCPSRCSFCYHQATQDVNKWRAQSIKKLRGRIKTLESFGIEGFEIIDDNFFVNLKRVEEFANMMIDEFSHLFWVSPGVRIDSLTRIDDKFMKLLEKSRCYQMGPAIESGSQRLLDFMQKDITIKQVYEVGEKFKKSTIIPYYPIIIGLPTETIGDLKKTLNLILYLVKENKRTKTSIFHSFRPTPGTDLFDYAVKSGFKAPKKLEDWADINMGYFNLPWLSPKRKRLLKKLYYLSYFIDRKCDYVESGFVKLFVKLYRPIALKRMKSFNFSLMFEVFFFDIYFWFSKRI